MAWSAGFPGRQPLLLMAVPAYHQCRQKGVLRREKHHLGNLPLEEAPERPDPQQPELLAEQREQQEALQRALDQLSPEHRQVLLLRVVQQMSYDEIAQALSLESGTVKSRISRARRQLREILLRQGNFFSDSAVLPNRKEG